MKKRISTYDHIQALVRNKQYLNDLGKISDEQVIKENGRKRLLTRYEKEENLLEKYKMHFIITPEFARERTRVQIEGQIIFFDDPVVSVQPQGDENALIEVRGKGIAAGTMTVDEPGYVLRERRFLTIEIDLYKKFKDIDVKIKQLVKSYRKYVKLDAAHDKTTYYDPWEIYDKHREGMNLLKIAKQKTGSTKNPAYDPILKADYNKVRSAYNYANNMIKKINPK